MWVFICEFSSLEAMLCEYLILLTIPTSIFLKNKINIKIKELLVPVFSNYQRITFFKERSRLKNPLITSFLLVEFHHLVIFLVFNFEKNEFWGFMSPHFGKEFRKIVKFYTNVPIDSRQYIKGYLKLFFSCIIYLYLNLVMYASATLTYVAKMDSTPIITSLLLPMAPMVTWHHPTHAGSNARGVKFTHNEVSCHIKMYIVNTLAALTLIILFSKMLKISICFKY
jgi:hypothetical protein